jgi:hypothetical protein
MNKNFNLPDIEIIKEKEPKGIFCWLYENDGKSICCFGAKHERGMTPQMKKIMEVCKEYKPDCIVVESYKQVIKDKDFSSFASSVSEDFQGNESLLGINLALRDNISVESCEPSDVEELKEMLDLYTPDELLAFYSFRGAGVVTTDLSKKTDKNETDYDIFYERYKNALQGLKPDYNPTKDIIFGIYKKWFGKDLHELAALEQNRYAWPATHELEWQRSNDISRSSNRVRNNFILNKLLELTETHKKIFLIYGKSHLPIWDEVLKDTLGIEEHKIIFEAENKDAK